MNLLQSEAGSDSTNKSKYERVCIQVKKGFYTQKRRVKQSNLIARIKSWRLQPLKPSILCKVEGSNPTNKSDSTWFFKKKKVKVSPLTFRSDKTCCCNLHTFQCRRCNADTSESGDVAQAVQIDYLLRYLQGALVEQPLFSVICFAKKHKIVRGILLFGKKTTKSKMT